VRFAFRRQDVSRSIGGFLALVVNNQPQSISLLDGEVAAPVDLSTTDWQTVEIPLEKLPLGFPYID